jgi:hypothetical protein
MRTRLLVALTVVSAVACTGCKYSTASLYREDIKTIYIEGFDNETFRRGLEVPLTRAIAGEVKLRTPFLLAPRNEADSVLSGTLRDVEERTRLRDIDNVVLSTRVRVTVTFRWRDRRAQTDIVPPRTVSESVNVTSAFGEDLFTVVMREVAKRVVEEMQAPW